MKITDNTEATFEEDLDYMRLLMERIFRTAYAHDLAAEEPGTKILAEINSGSEVVFVEALPATPLEIEVAGREYRKGQIAEDISQIHPDEPEPKRDRSGRFTKKAGDERAE